MTNKMSIKKMDITIHNRLLKEKRDINVYHHSFQSAHIVSANSSVTRSIEPAAKDDFLHISPVIGPGRLKNWCVLDLPCFIDFRFTPAGEVILEHSGERTLIRVPPGLPTWELKMTIPNRLPFADSVNGSHVTIGDADELQEDL